jgi:PAS domain S-box-containing protein
LLKHGFTLALIVGLGLAALAKLGWVEGDSWLISGALAVLGLIAGIGAWLYERLERSLSLMREAVRKLEAGESQLHLEPESATDQTLKPIRDMAVAVNRRLAELHTVIAQQRAIAEHAPDAMWVFHVETFRMIDVNENFARLTGYPRSRIIGLTPMDVSTATQVGGVTTREYAEGLVRRALAGEKLEVPWTVRRADGLEVACELRAIHLPAPGRTLISGSLMDISERVRTQAMLAQRMQFESLVTRLSTAFISLPMDRSAHAINSALAEIGRYARVDRSYVFEFDAATNEVSCTYEWCEEAIEPQVGRLQRLSVDTFRWVMEPLRRGQVVAVTRLSDLPPEAAAERAEWEAESIQSLLLVPMQSGSEVVGYVGFDAVRREMSWPDEIVALLKLFGEILSNLLARQRADAALQVQNEQLSRSNAELTRSNQELQQFAYVASHDLQEPLRAVGGFAGLLTRRYKGKLDAQADEYLEFLSAAAKRMQRMIVDLLDYSRLGHEPRPFQPCYLRQPVDAALAHLQTSIRELGAEIRVGELPTVNGDHAQLTQLFQNLIGNALKFHTAAAVPVIELRSERGNAEWIISVRDNGIGIDPERAHEVFQIFRRLHAQEQYPGTGIGLAVCKRIIERHRGRIWVDPDVTSGSRICFSLPAGAEAAIERAA